MRRAMLRQHAAVVFRFTSCFPVQRISCAPICHVLSFLLQDIKVSIEWALLTWRCIVLLAAFAEAQQALWPLQLLEVSIEFLHTPDSLGRSCAFC